MFTIKSPISGFHPAKTPPTRFGEFLEDTVPLIIFSGALCAFLWSPVLIKWLDQF